MASKLDKVLAPLKKKYGPGFSSEIPRVCPSIPTGCIGLDRALGVGGWPVGYINEVFGPPGGGKTTLCLAAAGLVTKDGGEVLFLDIEHKLQILWAEACIENQGGDVSLFTPLRQESGMAAMETLEAAIGVVKLIIVDSVAMLVTPAELESDLKDHHMAMQAKLMTKTLKRITHKLADSDTTLIFINQLRAKMGGYGGATEHTAAGRALKYEAVIKARVSKIETLQARDPLTGKQRKSGIKTRVKMWKNAVAPPWQEAEMQIQWFDPVGLDSVYDMFTAGVDLGVVDKRGSYYYYRRDEENGIKGIQGEQKVLTFLRQNTELFARLEADVRERLANPVQEQVDRKTGEIMEAKR